MYHDKAVENDEFYGKEGSAFLIVFPLIQNWAETHGDELIEVFAFM